MARHQGCGQINGGNKKKINSVKYLLETGTLAGMQAAKRKTEDLLRYHWANYSELARQRSQFQWDLIYHQIHKFLVIWFIRQESKGLFIHQNLQVNRASSFFLGLVFLKKKE